MAFSMSAWVSTNTASFSLISLLQPREYKSVLLPGKANTSRLYELAMSAVTSAPPFSADSTTIVASASQQSTIWCYVDLFIVVNPENAFILFHNRTINYENVIYACSNQDFILNLLKNRINIK